MIFHLAAAGPGDSGDDRAAGRPAPAGAAGRAGKGAAGGVPSWP
ncbi:hypothetical protein ACGFJC_36615 [Nonomuraea fuscirosea]|nr:hypothetical protein [Nonomuraea fuscirosea]WSA57209.1 hypothetical protein OIE67_22130 [Nonomuraea fuscirosea]